MAVEWKKLAYHISELTVEEQEVVGRLTGGSLDGIALGIADNNVVQMDDAGPAASGEYARFTANGIEGRPAADVMGDLSGQAAATFSMNTQKISALLDPTADQEAATKKYVDDRVVRNIEYILYEGGTVLSTGAKDIVELSFACTLVGWRLFSPDESGAIKIDIWKDSYANFPPTDADTMCNGHEPEITATGNKATDDDLSDWTTQAISVGDVLRFNVDSCTTITRAVLVLKVTV